MIRPSFQPCFGRFQTAQSRSPIQPGAIALAILGTVTTTLLGWEIAQPATAQVSASSTTHSASNPLNIPLKMDALRFCQDFQVLPDKQTAEPPNATAPRIVCLPSKSTGDRQFGLTEPFQVKKPLYGDQWTDEQIRALQRSIDEARNREREMRDRFRTPVTPTINLQNIRLEPKFVQPQRLINPELLKPNLPVIKPEFLQTPRINWQQ